MALAYYLYSFFLEILLDICYNISFMFVKVFIVFCSLFSLFWLLYSLISPKPSILDKSYFLKVCTYLNIYTYSVGKSRFSVVTTQNTELILISLFINHYIIFHTNKYKCTFAHSILNICCQLSVC